MIRPRYVSNAIASILLALSFAIPNKAEASSHQDAPLIILDPAANTTDVYAFRSNARGQKYLTVALGVYPFEEPGVGPNKWNFDDNVRYQIHVSTGADIAAGRPTITYSFDFQTSYKNVNTIAQSFLGVIKNVDDANQNQTQRYTVTKSTRNNDKGVTLFRNVLVPPNNQGLVSPFYNQGNNGENRAREGVASRAALDRYTRQTIASNSMGYEVFAGQRDDGFYADIHSIFDLDLTFSGPNKPFDSQDGFNLHMIVLNIPLSELGGEEQTVGVYATTSRQRVTVLRNPMHKVEDERHGNYVQVGRQGNPLFCEALVAIKDKDLYNRTEPSLDRSLFLKYALNPELATLLGLPSNLRSNRTDVAAIFIPDLIKVDLSTGPARRAGGQSPGAAPNDPGFSRLGIFGGDVLQSTFETAFLNNGTQPGGWPNGRRFGDDVVDIAVLALASDLRNPAAPILAAVPPDPGVDKVDHNDIGYNKVFPYAATPQNGRNHEHHQ
jgi:hypothetical protein